MSLLVLSYPDLKEKEFRLIQFYRSAYDELHKVVDPHFTLVFPVNGISPDDFIEEVSKRSAPFHSFEFKITKAIVHKDELLGDYQAFLVPEEGYENLGKLHDQLYAGQLRTCLRTDIPYLPHITIGKSTDRLLCEQITEEWNRKGSIIEGSVKKLSMVNYQNNMVKTLREINLEEK